MKILFIISSYNIYSGTPKKTLDLLNYFKNDAVLYVYNNNYSEFKWKFELNGARVYEGNYGKNLLKHYLKLRKIINIEKIEIVQTQFTFGEVLGYLAKKINTRIILLIAFVNVIRPSKFQRLYLSSIYNNVDYFVYISKYVKKEKELQFPVLVSKNNSIIYNGTNRRINNEQTILRMKHYSVLAVSGLTEIKNIQILVEAFNVLVNIKGIKDVFLYVAGDGPKKIELQMLIKKYDLGNHINLLGYQKNVGALINDCDIFVHPAYAEGFGIAVAEAMYASKPIIVSDAGALPELIEHEKSGLVVNPFNANDWVDAILRYKEDEAFSKKMAKNAIKKANSDFSSEKFANNYKELYTELVSSNHLI